MKHIVVDGWRIDDHGIGHLYLEKNLVKISVYPEGGKRFFMVLQMPVFGLEEDLALEFNVRIPKEAETSKQIIKYLVLFAIKKIKQHAERCVKLAASLD